MGTAALYDNSGYNADYTSNRKSNLNRNYIDDYRSIDSEADHKVSYYGVHHKIVRDLSFN